MFTAVVVVLVCFIMYLYENITSRRVLVWTHLQYGWFNCSNICISCFTYSIRQRSVASRLQRMWQSRRTRVSMWEAMELVVLRHRFSLAPRSVSCGACSSALSRARSISTTSARAKSRLLSPLSIPLCEYSVLSCICCYEDPCVII